MLRAFQKQYGSTAGVKVYRAPGRVNLIGEHTDYNRGFVLPIALDLATWVAIGPATDGIFRVWSENRKEEFSCPAIDLPTRHRSGHWSDYIVGVAQEVACYIAKSCGTDGAVRMVVHSTVPDGAGLSSSAALEVSTALALLKGHPIAPTQLALLAQRAENNFVGMPCGIMDQYVSVMGRDHCAIMIDCRSLESTAVALPGELAILAVNSMVKHELGQSAYRERTEECAMAVDSISRQYPQVQSLRDATLEHLDSAKLPAVVKRRARHIITEIKRVALFVGAASRGDLSAMGELFLESHRSMQHDYEISCEEIDFLVDAAIGIDGVYGSRMTGGGFGGCTVNLLRPAAVGRFEKEISALYRDRFGITPQLIPCVPSAGAGEEKLETVAG